MPESTEPKEQSASDVLLAAMSREEVFSARTRRAMKMLGLNPNLLSELSDKRKLELANALINQNWPS